MKTEIKDYLGDSVYAEFDGYHIVLTTNNGYGASNTIALDLSVYEALIQFKKRIFQEIKKVT